MKDLFEEIEGFEPKEKTVDDICLWHKSPTLTEGNEMYIKCYFECNGYDTKCPYYHDIKYFKDLYDTHN
jgi:hypothetical protein